MGKRAQQKKAKKQAQKDRERGTWKGRCGACGSVIEVDPLLIQTLLAKYRPGNPKGAIGVPCTICHAQGAKRALCFGWKGLVAGMQEKGWGLEDVPSPGPVNPTPDFRSQVFHIKQEFSPSFDPDHIASKFAADLKRL